MTMASSTRRLARTAVASAAATALCAALAWPALAQTQAPANPPAAQASDAPARQARSADMQKRYQDRMAQRQAALKEKLKLTAAQEGAWTSFTAALQPAQRPSRPDRTELEKLTTPERIDRMRELRAQHTAQADRRDEAVKQFYTALSPEQQKTFDAEFRRGGPGMHRGMHGRHGGPDGHHCGGRGPGAQAPAR
jgi:periplasmic protein CpxP/Spy